MTDAGCRPGQALSPEARGREEIGIVGEKAKTVTSAPVGRADPRLAAVTFVTTEHFTLQGARAATIAESTGRATMFLGSVSAGLVALGLIATATRLGATFYAFGVIVLAALSFVGLVTFEVAARTDDTSAVRR